MKRKGKEIENEIKNLKRVLEKYKIARPNRKEMQDRILKKKESIFKGVMKEVGQYSILYGAYLKVMTLLKKIGINVTTKNFIITIAVAISVSTGVYIAIELIKEKTIIKVEEDIKEEIIIRKETKSDKEKKKKEIKITYKLGIRPFTSSSVENNILESADRHVRNELARIKGNRFATKIASDKKANMKYILLGSIERMGGEITVFVKVVDMESTTIIYIAEERAVDIEEIGEACKRLARRMANKID